MSTGEGALPGSFRDPAGFLFRQQGTLYRQINQPYRPHYDRLLQSGLYQKLCSSGLMVSHDEVDRGLARTPSAYKIIRPQELPFISYPFEWSFSQLKDAALLTIRIQKTALEHDLSLKDASAYNIQFCNGKPLLIDTLSFEEYAPGRPWIAYRQFCQHFLAPLALMAERDVRLGRLLAQFLDGIPLDMASRLLPFSSRLRFSLLSHIHLHARSQAHFQDKPHKAAGRNLSRFSLMALIDSLESAVTGLKWRPPRSAWSAYYDHTNYAPDAAAGKKRCVDDFLAMINPAHSWDIGANTGAFSRLATERRIPTVSLDIDPSAVELNYLQGRREKNPYLLPLLGDIANPSPGIGWENSERMSLLERGPVDAVLALALIHHLAIANNLPLAKVAALFQRLCRWLIIEFIPKEDSQVQRLLASREDIFSGYHVHGFEEEFSRFFSIARREKIVRSERIVYLMKNRSAC
jgi:hypothetical protein